MASVSSAGRESLDDTLTALNFLIHGAESGWVASWNPPATSTSMMPALRSSYSCRSAWSCASICSCGVSSKYALQPVHGQGVAGDEEQGFEGCFQLLIFQIKNLTYKKFDIVRTRFERIEAVVSLL